MRKIIVSEFVTLDGVYQAPGDANEDRSGGFDLGGWQMPYFDDAAGAAINDLFALTGAILLGRRTYEIFAAFWPTQPDEDPFAALINRLPKHVASTTLKAPLSWSTATLLEGNVVDAVHALKEEPGGDIQVIGSGNLVQTLLKTDLVDELRLMIHPLLAGGGKRLFQEGLPSTRFRLRASSTSSTGVLIATYERA